MYKIEEFTTGNLYELEDFINEKAKENYSVLQILQNKIEKRISTGTLVEIPHYIIIFKLNE